MFSLAQIKEFSARAGREASRSMKVPFVPYPEDDLDEALRGIPNLGSYCPKGWKRVDLECLGIKGHGVYYGDNNGAGAFFIDASGYGSSSEPALSYLEFVEAVRDLLKVHGYEYGFGLCEEGQFQVKVGVYCKR